ncbi:hypothetical protein PG985_004912 [Apiospora marii]|uniref:uncharacterized protein n=1 Tax=Apiospora marii TaxID=335849 RepID=UPI00312D1590
MAAHAAGHNQEALRQGVAGLPGSPIDLTRSSPSGSTSTVSWKSGDTGTCSPISQALRPASPAATEQATSPSLSSSHNAQQGGTFNSPPPWSPDEDEALKAGRYPPEMQHQPRTPAERRPNNVQLPSIREMLKKRRYRRPPQSKDEQHGTGLPGIHKMLNRRVYSKRTKTGCLTCRERHKKCDEVKPFCTSTFCIALWPTS